jgi:hypothetical protein
MSSSRVDEAPDPGVQGQILPEAHQPGLKDVLAVRRRELTLVLGKFVVSAEPGSLGLLLPGDKGRARGDRGVPGKGGIGERDQQSRVGAEKPEARSR